MASEVGASGIEASADQPSERKQALYWDLIHCEDLDVSDEAVAAGPGSPSAGSRDGSTGHAARLNQPANDGCCAVPTGARGAACSPCHLVEANGDILVFEVTGPRSLLRRYVVAESRWRSQSLPITVHAAVPLAEDPSVICILHCPSDWNSDHRYEVHAFDTTTSELNPVRLSSWKSHVVDAGGIAPKKRHGFSIAPIGQSVYMFCGLQHFPGDVTGSFVYSFSFSDRMWTEVEYDGVFPAPYPVNPYAGCRFGQSCAVYNDKAWVYGGCIKHRKCVEPTNHFFTFDLVQHCWEEVVVQTDLQLPQMLGHCSLVCAGQVLIFGDEGASQDIYSFDGKTSSWDLLPPIMLGPRPVDGRILCCLSGNRLVAYQQTRESVQPLQCRCRHELFSVEVDQVFKVLQNSTTTVSQFPRNCRETDLIGDSTTADIRFNVDGKTIPAHRAVLRRFAPALAELCVGEDDEPLELVDFPDIKAEAMSTLLEHIYSRFEKPLIAGEAEALVELAHQFKFSVFSQRCQAGVVVDASNVRPLLGLALAKRPGLEILYQKCVDYLTSHPDHLSLLKSSGRPLVANSVSPEIPSLLPISTGASVVSAPLGVNSVVQLAEPVGGSEGVSSQVSLLQQLPRGHHYWQSGCPAPSAALPPELASLSASSVARAVLGGVFSNSVRSCGTNQLGSSAGGAIPPAGDVLSSGRFVNHSSGDTGVGGQHGGLQMASGTRYQIFTHSQLQHQPVTPSSSQPQKSLQPQQLQHWQQMFTQQPQAAHSISSAPLQSQHSHHAPKPHQPHQPRSTHSRHHQTSATQQQKQQKHHSQPLFPTKAPAAQQKPLQTAATFQQPPTPTPSPYAAVTSSQSFANYHGQLGGTTKGFRATAATSAAAASNPSATPRSPSHPPLSPSPWVKAPSKAQVLQASHQQNRQNYWQSQPTAAKTQQKPKPQPQPQPSQQSQPQHPYLITSRTSSYP